MSFVARLSLARSVARSLGRSLAPSNTRSLDRSLARSLARSLTCALFKANTKVAAFGRHHKGGRAAFGRAAPFVASCVLALKRAHVSERASERAIERASDRASDRWSERATERATGERRTTIIAETQDVPVRTLTHFGHTSVDLDSFWTYQCRSWLILDIPVFFFEHTSVNLSSF